MVPGFVQLGALAVLLQLVVVAALSGYVHRRCPVAGPTARRRTLAALVAGAGLVAAGQLAALGAVGSLRVAPTLSLRTAIRIQDAGFLVALVGSLLVAAALLARCRASD